MPINAFGQPIGAPVADWTPRRRPERSTLSGDWCRLEPLDATKHADGLFAAYRAARDDRDWTYTPFERPADLAAYRMHVATQATSLDPLHFAIVPRDSVDPLGTAALMRIDTTNGVAEVGHIVFAPQLMRTPAGTEALALLMRHVFDDLGYRRLEWKCDSRNEPSRRAALRYGFAFEGIFRQAIVTKARNRDTAWYALIDGDWPHIKAAFAAWLSASNFDAAGAQRRTLADIRSNPSGAPEAS